MKILVTGGAGFIGSSYVNLCIELGYDTTVVDKLTYAANLDNLNSGYKLIAEDICNLDFSDIEDFDYIVNFAAESHVDNSLIDGDPFIKTNIQGTYNLIELAKKSNKLKKFVQISTDEVYGDLDDLNIDKSSETDPIHGSSYYSATKASADLLVQAAGRSFNLPFLITRTCNNFGDNQNQEKFIPKLIQCKKENKPYPVYGDGLQKREWIWVEDNVKAIEKLMKTHSGIYNIGSGNVLTNLEIVKTFECSFEYVEDRKGHDKRYSLDNSKVTKELGIVSTLDIISYLKSKS